MTAAPFISIELLDSEYLGEALDVGVGYRRIRVWIAVTGSGVVAEVTRQDWLFDPDWNRVEVSA